MFLQNREIWSKNTRPNIAQTVVAQVCRISELSDPISILIGSLGCYRATIRLVQLLFVELFFPFFRRFLLIFLHAIAHDPPDQVEG